MTNQEGAAGATVGLLVCSVTNMVTNRPPYCYEGNEGNEDNENQSISWPSFPSLSLFLSFL